MRLAAQRFLKMCVGLAMCFAPSKFAAAAVIAHYSFDEAGGAFVADNSGNGNNGTLQINGGTGVLGAPGKFNNAVSLADGAWVEATNATFSSIEASDWTVTAFVTATGSFSDSNVIGEFSQPFGASPGSRWRPMNPYLDGGNVHMFSTFRNPADLGHPNGQDVAVSDVANSIASDGTTWTHLAVTWDRAAKTLKVFVNGSLVDTQTSGLANVDIMPMASTLQIGRKGLTANVNQFWYGKIDEIWAFNEVLDSTAVNNLKNFNVVPEPNTIIPCGIGLIMCGIKRKCRRKVSERRLR